MTTILPVVSALAGVVLGAIGASLIYLPKINALQQERDCLADILSEVAIENDLLHAERKGRSRVHTMS